MNEDQVHSDLAMERIIPQASLTLDALPLLAYIAERGGAVRYVNRRWLEYTQLPFENSLGLEGAQVIHPDDRSKVLEAYHQAIVGGGTFACDYRIRRADGRSLSFRGRAEPLLDEAGEILGWIGTATPLEGLLPDPALHSGEPQLAATSRLSRHYRVLIVDDNSIDAEILERALRERLPGRVRCEAVLCAEQALEILEQETFDCVLLDNLLPDLNGVELLEQHRFPCAVVMLTGEGDEYTAVRALRAGAQDYLSKTAHPGAALAHALERAVGRFELERELERQHHLNQAILGSFNDALLTLDADLRLVYVNTVFEGLTGHSGPQMLGRSLWEVFPQATGQGLEQQFKDALERGQARTFEYQFPDNGRWYGIRLYPSSGQLSVMFQDITLHKQTQRELEHSERRFRALVEASSHLIYTVNAQVQDHASQVWWQSFTGQSTETSGGLGWLAVVHPEDRERVKANWQKSLTSQSRFADEYRVQRAGGGYGWLRARAVPLESHSGQEWVGTLEDITPFRQAEADLITSQQWLNLALDATQMGVWSWDLLSNQATWSAAQERLYGLEPGTFPGTLEALFEQVHPDDVAQLQQVAEQSLAGQNFFSEFRILTRQGAQRWIRGVGLVQRDAKGRPTRMDGVNYDITERKEAELALLESQQRLTLALGAARMGVWSWNLLTDAVVWSPEQEALFGFAPGEFAGTAESLRGRIHPHDLPLLEEITRRSVQGEPYHSEYRVCLPNGSERWLCGVGQLERDAAGQPQRMVGVSYDISERKASEQQLERQAVQMRELLDLQKRFVSDASHELRAPLTGIQGNLELLRMYPQMAPEDRAEAIEDAEREAIRLGRLITDLLNLARGDSGVTLNLEPLELCKLLHQVVRSSQHFLDRHTLECVLEGELWIEGDRDRLKQLAFILLENAARYTPSGGRIWLSLHRDAGRIGFSVRDSGIGIAESDLPHIFERFYRTDHSRNVDSGGTGLGLSIAQWIVEQHGGQIEVCSTPGEGTAFWIGLLPARLSE